MYIKLYLYMCSYITARRPPRLYAQLRVRLRAYQYYYDNYMRNFSHSKICTTCYLICATIASFMAS